MIMTGIELGLDLSFLAGPDCRSRPASTGAYAGIPNAAATSVRRAPRSSPAFSRTAPRSAPSLTRAMTSR